MNVSPNMHTRTFNIFLRNQFKGKIYKYIYIYCLGLHGITFE